MSFGGWAGTCVQLAHPAFGQPGWPKYKPIAAATTITKSYLAFT